MSPKNLYGAMAVLLAGLVISASAAGYYYYQYGLQSSVGSQSASDLSNAMSQYNQLASRYDSALSAYNQTLALLAGTAGALNTSLPIYAQASSQLPGLWNSYLRLKPQSAHVYSANILLNFGNGTRQWNNNTQLQPGWNLYTATLVVTGGRVQATWYPSFGEHLVNAIDGVAGTKTSYWIVWTYNSTALWQKAAVGADDLPIHNGSVFAWTFCGQTCKP